MKIVNRKEFLELPKGTVYSLFQPNIFNGLFVKISSSENDCGNDFAYIPLIDGFIKGSDDNNVQHEELEHFEFDLDCSTRDGMYNDKQLYAIYDKNDILKLVARLTYSFLKSDREV